MKNVLTIAQILLSVLLIVSILLQSRGSGLSGSFGGAGEFYRTRRGFEKVLLRLTVIIALLFLISSIANVLIN